VCRSLCLLGSSCPQHGCALQIPPLIAPNYAYCIACACDQVCYISNVVHMPAVMCMVHFLLPRTGGCT
jgi:hypothetical protein